ncbi:MAG: hypothetical protein Q9178_002856 [Gyalolechia marmorata]
MVYATNTIQSLTSELHQSTKGLAQDLINIPVLLDKEIEPLVEALLKEMATVLAMLEEEQVDLENALRSMP